MEARLRNKMHGNRNEGKGKKRYGYSERKGKAAGMKIIWRRNEGPGEYKKNTSRRNN